MTFLQAGEHQIGFEDYYKEISNTEKNSKNIFICKSPVMKVLNDKINSLALLPSSVLILGASGTGRTTVAREIFERNNDNHSKQFIKLTCYGLDQNIIEEKLFGNNETKGLLDNSENDTLFIKGLECLDLNLQKKLMTYLSSRKDDKPLPRLICSASENLSQKVKEEQFLQELFEFLSQNFLILPTLSERSEDVPFFISLFNKQNNLKTSMSENALQVLKAHFWKGNITELKKTCLQLSILCSNKEFIATEDLYMINKEQFSMEKNIKYNPNVSLEKLINDYIQLSLNHFQSKRKSAEALGISVKTIYNKIKTGSISSY